MIDQYVNQDNWRPTFELSLVVRDAKGNDTGKRKDFSTNSAYKLGEFFDKNQTRPKKKISKKNQKVTAEEAGQSLQELYKDDDKRVDKLDEVAAKFVIESDEGAEDKENV